MSITTTIFHRNKLPRERPARCFMTSFGFHLCLLPILLLAYLIVAVVALSASDRSELLRRVTLLHLRHALHRDVQLGSVALDPSGKVVLTELVIPESAPSRDTFTSIKRIEIRFSPLRLGAFPTRPMSAIRQVIVDDPFLRVTRNARGLWNFDELLQGERKPSADRFRAEVVVRNGEVIYRDAHGWKSGPKKLHERLVDVSARMLSADEDFLPFRISAKTTTGNIRVFTAQGSYHPTERRADCQMRFGEVDLAFVQQFLPKKLPVTITSGKADGRWQFTLVQDPLTHKAKLTMTVLADIRNARGMLRMGEHKATYEIATGQMRLAEGMVEFVDLHGVVGGVPVVCNGTVSHFTKPIFALQVKTLGADAQRLTQLIPGMQQKDLTWSGHVDGWATLTGQENAMAVTGHVAGPSLVLRLGESQMTLHDLQSDVRFRGSSLELTRVSGRTLGGRFSGDGWLAVSPEHADTPQSSMLFKGTMVDVQAADLAQLIAVDRRTTQKSPLDTVTGTLSGSVACFLARDGKFSLISRAHGKLALAAFAEGEVEASVRVDLAKDGPPLTTIERARVRTAEGTFDVQGTLDDTRLDLAVRGSALDLSEVGKRFQRADLSGKGYVVGKLTGEMNAPAFSGTVRAQDGNFGGHAFTELAGDVQASIGTPSQLQLQNLRLVAGGGEVELSASEISASFGNKGEWHLKQAALSRVRLSVLGTLLGVQLPLDGFVEGAIELVDYPIGAQGKGRVIIRRPTLHVGDSRLEMDSATIAFQVKDERTLEISEAKFIYEGLPSEQSMITVRGRLTTDPSVPPSEQLALTIERSVLPVDNLIAFSEAEEAICRLGSDGRMCLPMELDGSMIVAGRVTGQLVDPERKISAADLLQKTLVVKGSIEGSHDFAVARHPFRQFATELEYRSIDHSLHIDRFVLSPADRGRDYMIALASPSSITFEDSAQIFLHLALQGEGTDARGNAQPADLKQLRADLLAIIESTRNAVNATTDNPFTQKQPLPLHAFSDDRKSGLHEALDSVVTYLNTVQEPFAGKALCKVSIEESLAKPVISAELSADKLVVNGQAMPRLYADLMYDMAPRILYINQLIAKGEGDAEGTLKGSIQLPVKDANGKELVAGPMKLELEAQNLNPGLLANWFPGSGLSELGGEIYISASTIDDKATTSKPHMRASVEWHNPVVQGIPLGTVNAILSLESDNEHPGMHRLWIGQQQLRTGGATTIQLKDSNQENPLELSGYLPINLGGAGQPIIPTDKPFEMTLRIPERGLDVVNTYLAALTGAKPNKPTFTGKGVLKGQIQVAGTLANPVFSEQSYLLAKAPQLVLPVENQDIPNRLSDVVCDIGFRSRRLNGHVENIIEVNDISGLYDRTDAPKDKLSLIERARLALGIEKAKAPQYPGFRIGGTVSIVPPAKGLPSMKDVRYDLYTRIANTPFHWEKLFAGTVNSYLHLGNRPDDATKPLLTGVVYAEKSKLTYRTTAAKPVAPLRLPFNPDISLFVQVGPNNSFVIEPDSAIFSTMLYGDFALKSTGPELFSPDVLADPAYVESKQHESRYPVTKEDVPLQDRKPLLMQSPLYMLSAASLPQSVRDEGDANGTYGMITGSLEKPVIDVAYSLVPRKSQVQSLGGTMTIESAQGTFHFAMGEEQPVSLFVKAKATSTLNSHKISAEIDGKIDANLLQNQDQLTDIITFTDNSQPAGEKQFTSDEIFARLIGVPDLLNIVQGKERITSPELLAKYGPNMLLTRQMRDLASTLGLETLSVSFDSSWNPEATFATPEFAGAFRLGSTFAFNETEAASWRAWLEYRIPKFKNLSITGEVNNDRNPSGLSNGLNSTLNLQYQLPFTTSIKD